MFQLPGWSIAAVLLSGLWHWEILPLWLSVTGFVGWVLKDFFLYPFVRTAYEATEGKAGLQGLVGARGVAEGNLAPEGFVRVRGELWRAVANPNERMIYSGTKIEILATDGMKLRVRALDAD